MSRLSLTLAISDYDHVADLVTGRVQPQGIDLNWLNLQIEEIFFRELTFHEFDLSELSLAKHASLISQGDRHRSALPVFPLRLARHSSIYVRRDGPVRAPGDLKGRRVGLPEWAQTAAVYTRGLLMHEYDVPLSEIEWIQAGVNEPGRVEKVALRLPEGISLRRVPDKSLSEMLLAGELDAVLSAHPPDCFVQRRPGIGRLFEDFIEVERRYIERTGIFPIMHVIGVRQELLDRYPWIAMNLLAAFETAKNRSLQRALFVGSRYPVPWSYEYARQAQSLLGEDFWPYGIEPNRPTLSAFLQYAYEQGVCHRRLQPEDLFAPQIQQRFRL